VELFVCRADTLFLMSIDSVQSLAFVSPSMERDMKLAERRGWERG
jgi:hypothetical protein